MEKRKVKENSERCVGKEIKSEISHLGPPSNQILGPFESNKRAFASRSTQRFKSHRHCATHTIPDSKQKPKPSFLPGISPPFFSFLFFLLIFLINPLPRSYFCCSRVSSCPNLSKAKFECTKSRVLTIL